MRRRLPEPDPGESVAAGLLRLCPDPLPLAVLARVLHKEESTIPVTLARVLHANVVTIRDGLVKLLDPLADGIPSAPSTQTIGAALAALLNFIADRQNAIPPPSPPSTECSSSCRTRRYSRSLR